MTTAKTTGEETAASPPIIEEAKPNGARGPSISESDWAKLDVFEQLEQATLLDDSDEPEDSDEPSIIEVNDRVPKWTAFRVNPETTFDMWGVVNQDGMDKTIIVATKEFAPEFEAEEVELRRVRFYETVTSDGIVRLVYTFLPDKGSLKPNTWLTSKRDALEHVKSVWTMMSSRKKLGKFTFKRCRKDYGEPVFSRYTRGQLIEYGLRKPGLLAENKEHPFYRKITEADD